MDDESSFSWNPFNWQPATLYFRTQDEAYSYGERPPSGWNPVVEKMLQQLEMPLLWDRSCTSLGGCPEGTRCAQATQSSLVCDTGLIRDMVEPSLASWTAVAVGHGRRFGAEYPLIYVVLLISSVLAVWLPLLLVCRGCCRCVKRELRWGSKATVSSSRPRRRRRRRLPDSDDDDSDENSDDSGEDDLKAQDEDELQEGHVADELGQDSDGESG